LGRLGGCSENRALCSFYGALISNYTKLEGRQDEDLVELSHLDPGLHRDGLQNVALNEVKGLHL
jgi:hypothetical protein